jgi:hypothetical protein
MCTCLLCIVVVVIVVVVVVVVVVNKEYCVRTHMFLCVVVAVAVCAYIYVCLYLYISLSLYHGLCVHSPTLLTHLSPLFPTPIYYILHSAPTESSKAKRLSRSGHSQTASSESKRVMARSRSGASKKVSKTPRSARGVRRVPQTTVSTPLKERPVGKPALARPKSARAPRAGTPDAIRARRTGASGPASARGPGPHTRQARPKARRAVSAVPQSAASRAAAERDAKELEKLRKVVNQTQSELVSALQLVESLRQSHEGERKKRQAAEQETTDLKIQLVDLTQQITEQMDTGDFMHQIEELQTAVIEYQQKYDEMKRSSKKDGGTSEATERLKNRVQDLEQVVDSLQVEYKKLQKEKSPDLSEFHNQIEQLQTAILDYQNKHDTLKKRNAELERAQRVRGKDKATSKLNERVQNLQFQLFYGAAEKDKEIDKLKEAAAADTQSSKVERVKRRMDKLQQSKIEEWLFSGDANEAL